MFKKINILLLLLLLFLTACPKEPIFYSIFIRNPKIFIHQNSPGDPLLPNDKKLFLNGLHKFNVEYSTGFGVCMNEIRGIRECIESQPEKKIYVFVFSEDTLAAYDYEVVRDEKKYIDRIEIPYTMATNDANLVIAYP
jgi:hypothetical protein